MFTPAKALPVSLSVLLLGTLGFLIAFSLMGKDGNRVSESQPDSAGSNYAPYEYTLENPVTPEWLKENISKERPRVILTAESLAQLKQAITEGGLIASYYEWIHWNADQFLTAPPLTRKMDGKRLLDVARQALARITCLSLVINLEEENDIYVSRLTDEILSICSFTDWNPSHFLDTAEMGMAISIGLDWCYHALAPETIEVAENALVNLALKPGLNGSGHTRFLTMSNNWNQVCNGGLCAAAVTVAEIEPELAAKIISQALETMTVGLEVYHPDGLYPEGVSYWGYGTYYSAFVTDVFLSAFGQHFGLIDSPGFMSSALGARMMVAPSGDNYDFFDCAPRMKPMRYWPLVAWFDVKTGERQYFLEEELTKALERKLSRKEITTWIEPLAMAWLAQVPVGQEKSLPENWVARSKNPIVVFRKNDDPRGFYFGAKGGRANLSHGNMDAGSFIYVFDVIRWRIDSGNQSYAPLEEIIGENLWNDSQDSDRWSLLTKNNFGHSTITINDALHRADGSASLSQVDEKTVVIDLTSVFGKNVEAAKRRICRTRDYQVKIEDTIIPNEKTESIVHSLITTADVELHRQQVILHQNGRSVKIAISKPVQPRISVVSLDPPPLEYDRHISGLKRIEIRLGKAEIKPNQPVEYFLEISPAKS